MADALDHEAAQRGISRQALIAYYMKQREMTGVNGSAAPTSAQPAARQPQPPKAPSQDNRGYLQRILDGLSGH